MAAQDIVPYRFDSSQSRTKAAENGRKGGKASGVAKRAKRDAQQIAKMVLDFEPEISGKMLENMHRMGMPKRIKKPNVNIIGTVAIGQKIMKGDEKALRFMLEMAGEINPQPLVEIHAPAIEGEESNRNLVELTMERMTDEQLRVFEEICALYHEVEAEQAERANAADAQGDPIELQPDDATVT